MITKKILMQCLSFLILFLLSYDASAQFKTTPTPKSPLIKTLTPTPPGAFTTPQIMLDTVNPLYFPKSTPTPAPPPPFRPQPAPSITLMPIHEPSLSTPMELEADIVMSVCLELDDVTEECINKSLDQAADDLAEHMIDTFHDELFTNSARKYFSVVFPVRKHYKEAIKALFELETKAITIVSNRLKADMVKLKPFKWDSKAIKVEKMAVIKRDEKKIRKWEREARAEATSRSNWTAPSERKYTYKLGNAYRQLEHINSFGWGGF